MTGFMHDCTYSKLSLPLNTPTYLAGFPQAVLTTEAYVSFPVTSAASTRPKNVIGNTEHMVLDA